MFVLRNRDQSHPPGYRGSYRPGHLVSATQTPRARCQYSSARPTKQQLPKSVGTLAKMLLMGAIPIFIRAPMRTAIHLPQSIGALSNHLVLWSKPCFVWDETSSSLPNGSSGPPRLTCILVVKFLRSASGDSCAWAADFKAFSSYSASIGATGSVGWRRSGSLAPSRRR
jgi:hypothetical protein